MIGRNEECWCGSGKKWKKCHFPAPPVSKNSSMESKNEQQTLRLEYLRKYQIHLKNADQIEKIRASCVIASQILEAICAMAKPGVTTQELDDYAVRLHREAGVIAAPLHYGEPPYPKSICTSLNEVICHGIPDKTVLKEGDILNIDVSTILNGYYGDCSRMVTVGQISPEKQLVVDTAYECLMESIAILKPGIPISKIGDTIEDHAAKKGCSVVNQFVGHGVGLDFHENPQVAHHRNKSGILLAPGMIFTIEPMINAGVREGVIDPHDKWTARTKDGRPSAQWEHTVLITDDGHEILTTWKR